MIRTLGRAVIWEAGAYSPLVTYEYLCEVFLFFRTSAAPSLRTAHRSVGVTPRIPLYHLDRKGNPRVLQIHAPSTPIEYMPASIQ